MKKTISSERKDELFRHPESGTIHYGRHFSVCGHGEQTWASIQMGEDRETRVALLYADRERKSTMLEGGGRQVHRPTVVHNPKGQVEALWDEAVDGGWNIRHTVPDTAGGSLNEGDIVRASRELCLPPVAAYHQDVLYVAWAERLEGTFRIMLSEKRDAQWSAPRAISAPGADAFRPHMAADGGTLAIVWDEYRDHHYRVVCACLQGGEWNTLPSLGEKNERWLHPRVSVGPDGTACLVWVALKPVIDKLGIIDHWPIGMAARIEGSNLTPLLDKDHSSDPRIIADLRDGLLASRIYKGYVGLRRNPQPAFDDKGRFWCFWEVRTETTGSTVAGPLVGRCLDSSDRWSLPSVIAQTGYCYAVPVRFESNKLPLAYLRFDCRERDVPQLELVDPTAGKPHFFDETRWRRWQNVSIQPEEPIKDLIEKDGQTYRFYWADTHVHSVFSPDAEGELDELVHFARDQAGLNILTVIDNDYYPHKALTEPEWRIHQALAAHFSQAHFRWIPGYEFTNHRADLSPDFNHRCVLYPDGTGKLQRRIDPDTRVDSQMIPALKKAGAMPYPHHCTYDIIDNDVEWNIEVTSSWRVCIEETDFTMRELRAGKHLGFIGSSDTHRAVPGLGGARTAVLATDLTPEAIWDAYRKRRLIATQGHNLFVDFRVCGAITGEIVETQNRPIVMLKVRTPEPLDYIEIIRDGEVVHTVLSPGSTCEIEWVDHQAKPGKHFYFPRIKMVGDPSFNRDGYDPATNNPQPFSQDSRYPHNLARARGPFAWASPIHVTISG